MLRFLFSLFAAVVVIPISARAAAVTTERGTPKAEAAGGLFFDPQSLDLKKILPPPPAPDSLAGRAELETVLQVQAARSPEQVAWAEFIEEDRVFKNDRVLGSWFAADNLPATAAFFGRVDALFGALKAKGLYPRKRPPYVDARVKPCVPVADTGAYPSGHALRAWVWAGLLAEIFPEQREVLAERARAVCWGRVIGGVHFPSDTVGGRLLAEAVVAELLKNPAVRAEIEKCRAEAQPFWLKKAA